MKSVDAQITDATRPVAAGGRRLIVSWQHPITRAIEPVGQLTFDGHEYKFDYFARARDVDGFVPLLGFDDIDASYTSSTLFPFFAQRIMDPRRPDYKRHLHELALDDDDTPWELLSRSHGAREGDTIQLFPVPQLRSESWHCYFLVNGVRHLMTKSVPVHGIERGMYSIDQLEALIGSLKPGDELTLHPEPTNQFSQLALLVLAGSEDPLGYVPDLLTSALDRAREAGTVQLHVEHVNSSDAGWHLRILVEMEAQLAPDFDFFAGEQFRLAAHA